MVTRETIWVPLIYFDLSIPVASYCGEGAFVTSDCFGEDGEVFKVFSELTQQEGAKIVKQCQMGKCNYAKRLRRWTSKPGWNLLWMKCNLLEVLEIFPDYDYTVFAISSNVAMDGSSEGLKDLSETSTREYFPFRCVHEYIQPRYV